MKAPKQKKLAPPNLNGIHLWDVKTTAQARDEHLWITTEKFQASEAVRKANRFLRDTQRPKSVVVDRVSHCGTIDA